VERVELRVARPAQLGRYEQDRVGEDPGFRGVEAMSAAAGADERWLQEEGAAVTAFDERAGEREEVAHG
jgi:hypothetical protein